MENVKNILVAIDLGESSAQALVEARALAGRFGSALHVLCVVQDPAALSWAPGRTWRLCCPRPNGAASRRNSSSASDGDRRARSWPMPPRSTWT
jgi:nucleotide-binding universal stress UspA family protein